MIYPSCVAIALSLLFCSCSGAKKERHRSHTFHTYSPTDPSTFDPRMGRDLTTLNIAHQLFAPLVRIDSHGELILDLAKDITAEDEHTYIITLSDAVWSDGRPVTAYDIRYSWLSILDPHRHSPQAPALFVIRGAKEFHEGVLHESGVKLHVMNDKEIRVQLKNRCPFFKALLATPGLSIIPAYFDQTIGTWGSASSIPASGPFTVKKYIPKNILVLEKNPSYIKADQIGYDSVEIHFLDDATSISMFERGTIDWVGSPLGSLVPDAIVDLRKKRLLHSNEAAGTGFLRTNTLHPYLSDPNIRKAISNAIKRDDIIHHILLDGFSPALSLVPPCLFRPTNAHASEQTQQERETLAKEQLFMFCEKFKKQPQDISLRLAYGTSSERSKRIAQALQQNLQQVLGIQIELTPYDSQFFYQRVSTLDYDLAIGSWFADYPNPCSFFSVFENKNNGTNNTGWENKHYQALMKHLMDAKTGSAQEALIYTSLLDTLKEDMPIIPLYYFSYVYATKHNPAPIHLSSLGYFDFHKE